MRYRGGVAPKSRASVRTVRFIFEAPCLGGLTGASPHLGSSACQASTELTTPLGLEDVILLGYDFAMLQHVTVVILFNCAHGKLHPESATLRK